MDEKIVDFSAHKKLNETSEECQVYKEMYYELARAVESAIECDTKRESDKLLVIAQRIAEYKYLSHFEEDIESLEIFMAGFNVDDYLDNLKKTKKE